MHHQQQHKQRKESKEIDLNKTNQELRSTVKKLTRENARLRREIEKLIAHLSTPDDEDFPELVIPEQAKEGCPGGCETPLKSLQIGDKTITVCPTCRWRHTETIQR